MNLRLGKITVKIHGVLPLLWLFAWITGAGKGLLPAFLALLLHECGHLTAAKLLKMPVQNIEITPYGGVITIERLEFASPLSRFILAFSGPLSSFFGCFLSGFILQTGCVNFEIAQNFFKTNLVLCLFNLLPALPLDGGQMLSAFLSRFFPYRKVAKALTGVGSALGLLLCLISFLAALQGELNFSPIFAGVYLLYAAAIEQKQSTARYISQLINRRQRMEKNEVLPTELLAACGKATPLSILRYFNQSKYHEIIVLGEDGMEKLGIIDEQTFCAAVMQNPNAPLRSLLPDIKNGQDQS